MSSEAKRIDAATVIAERVIAYLHTLDGLNPCLRRAPEDQLRDLRRDVSAIVGDALSAVEQACAVPATERSDKAACSCHSCEVLPELHEQVAQMCEYLGSKREEVPCDSWHLRDLIVKLKAQAAKVPAPSATPSKSEGEWVSVSGSVPALFPYERQFAWVDLPGREATVMQWKAHHWWGLDHRGQSVAFRMSHVSRYCPLPSPPKAPDAT